MALLGRAGEIQRVGDRQKIADLMHFHRMTVPASPPARKAEERIPLFSS
jgi:hypothetical protein